MDRDAEVLDIYNSSIDNEAKIRLLEDVVLDMHNELEAMDQNMHPEIHNSISNGLQLATDLLRELRATAPSV